MPFRTRTVQFAKESFLRSIKMKPEFSLPTCDWASAIVAKDYSRRVQSRRPAGQASAPLHYGVPVAGLFLLAIEA